jgi:glycosyltransferase involved in cell wall biosynthesis
MVISVIVPVYNIEKKKSVFEASIESVLKQSYRDFELIIVNDGSKDKTENILRELAKKDKRIRFITKENGGVESSRRAGINIAQGDFILHMDQDDRYRKDAFEIFIRKMEETNADVVVANHIRFLFCPFFSFGKYNAESMQRERIIDHESFMEKYYVSFFGMNDLPVNIWNKMYRKKFLDSIPTPPKTGHIIEDLSYNMHVLPYAKRIVVIPDVLYYYRWGGFTNRYDKSVLETALIGYKLKMNQIEKYGLLSFKAYTAVELLNYLNTYFYQIVEYDVFDEAGFVAEFNKVMSLPEVKGGMDIVRDYGRYHNEFADAFLSSDHKRLYAYELTTKRNNRGKIFAKKLLLNI